jgi:CRISPR/Cas system-associated exonuclease Cas4 (RecB family)
MEVFQDGLDIIDDFVRDQGKLDHRNVLGVEKEFRLPVGRFTVLGFIDRVDWVDDETVEVIDYKTNRVLFTRDEADQSLQMSLYHLAARMLWPWAKNVRLTFHMLRHGVRMRTERTEEQLQAALAYVQTLGEMTEQATEFPARINSNCIYCDHRRNCTAYADALQGKREEICEGTSDIEAVAKEREEVAHLAKILYSRKSELDDVIKTHLKEQDELLVDGVRYKMFNNTRLEYPFEPTLRVLEDTTGLSRDELVTCVATIDKKAVDKLVKKTGEDRARSLLLKAELENVATKSHSPRLWSRRAA